MADIEATRERNQRIVNDYRAAGMTKKAIADKHGISVERVREIVSREERLEGFFGGPNWRQKNPRLASLSGRTQNTMINLGVDSDSLLLSVTEDTILALGDTGPSTVAEVNRAKEQ